MGPPAAEAPGWSRATAGEAVGGADRWPAGGAHGRRHSPEDSTTSAPLTGTSFRAASAADCAVSAGAAATGLAGAGAREVPGARAWSEDRKSVV